jgi:cysteinyl-tRNA synthetase
MLVLQTSYRRQVEMGDTELRQAAAAVERLDALARRARISGIPDVAPGDAGAFLAAMDDDFDTPAALAVIFDLVREANLALDRGADAEAAALVSTVRSLTGVLGLGLDDGATGADAGVDALVAAREAARAAKDWAEADRIRDELADRGITLEDTPHGTVWHR